MVIDGYLVGRGRNERLEGPGNNWVMGRRSTIYVPRMKARATLTLKIRPASSTNAIHDVSSVQVAHASFDWGFLRQRAHVMTVRIHSPLVYHRGLPLRASVYIMYLTRDPN